MNVENVIACLLVYFKAHLQWQSLIPPFQAMAYDVCYYAILSIKMFFLEHPVINMCTNIFDLSHWHPEIQWTLTNLIRVRKIHWGKALTW